MFSTPTQPAQGVSAVKALQLASSQGQRIYHITQANQAQVLPQLHLDGLAMSEISQGLAAGREVITHTDRISIPGWTGEGYIIYDPITGAGAYKIAGGSNGGFVVGWSLGVLFTFSLIVFVTTISSLLLPALLALITMISTVYTLLQLQDVQTVTCINLGFTIGFSMVLNTLIIGIGTALAAILGVNVMFNSIDNFEACIRHPS